MAEMEHQERRRRLPQQRMIRTSLQLPESIAREVRAEAARRGISRSAVIVEVLAEEYHDEAVQARLVPLLEKQAS